MAKSHGIYGFGIYYYWFSGKYLLEKPINIFLKNSYINFNFLLIWANENWTMRWDGLDKKVLIKQEYKPKDPMNFIKDIKRYINDKRYIRIKNMPIIGLYKPKDIPNLNKTISIWRERARKLGIGEIFILINVKGNRLKNFKYLNLFNASYEFPPINSGNNHKFFKNGVQIYSYSELLYKIIEFNESNIDFKKFPFFRGVMLEWDNCARRKNCKVYKDYSPEQFYLFNKLIINWTLNHYNNDHKFIFINAWNEWGEGSYLEPDNKYGYASINSFSKAIFNLSFIENYKSFANIRIVVLAIINNDTLIKEIIDKIKNIPYIYDLYIISEIEINLEIIKKYITLNSNKYLSEIILYLKRENSFPFLSNFRNKIKKYKYICNINTNRYRNITYFKEWKNYIYNNLLGNSKIISEIITDFELNKKLGLIFPLKYYKSFIHFGLKSDYFELKFVNLILKKLYPFVNISKIASAFPEGNMFWGKISAVYPVLKLFSNKISNKKNILILKVYLEKILVYIININGFLYKTIFKHL